MHDLFDRILLLKRSMAFSEVSTENLKVVARALVEETYLPGECVFEIDDRAEHMYLVAAGAVGISLSSAAKTERYITVLGPGECFGEMGLLDDQVRSATACVLEQSQLLVLEKSRLLGLIPQYPELAVGMLRSLSLRLREANKRYEGDQKGAGSPPPSTN